MSKIPEGATHYFIESSPKAYRKKINGFWCAYADGDWVRTSVSVPDDYYHPIQAATEWAPSTGSIVRCGTHNRDVEILTEPELVPCVSAACRALDNNELFWGGQFSTIKTPEQIAAEKRDAAIKEMQRLVGSCNTFPFAELYDYGYRLQVEK